MAATSLTRDISRNGGLRRKAIESLLVDLFVKVHRHAPRQIVLDFDATDNALHSQQEGRFFHGCYDNYCQSAAVCDVRPYRDRHGFRLPISDRVPNGLRPI
jgi:hypothetical protein